MVKILKTPDGKRVKINPPTDICLYESPENPPNTGTVYTRGSDLFAHRARSSTWYFYIVHWSMWQGGRRKISISFGGLRKKFYIGKSVQRWMVRNYRQ